MPRRVRFIADFDYKPKPQVTVAYKAGTTKLVKTECADQAVAAGKAQEIEPRSENGKIDAAS